MSIGKIYIETEKYQDGGEGDFYVFKLSGDTYAAKEIIKECGFVFSDQIGYGKAWRTPAIFTKDFFSGNPGFDVVQKMVKNVRIALTNAGYEYYKK